MGQIHVNENVHTAIGGTRPGKETLTFHRRLPDYHVTPLTSVEKLANTLGVANVWVKDESRRLGLPAFKILGASWALYCELIDRFHLQIEPWDHFEQLRQQLQGVPRLTLVTATDGNHGRGVARVASWFGFQARIFMPKGTVQARIEAIESEGAEVIIVEGDYDKTVEAAAKEQETHTLLIQDTAWPGYETVPRRIVEGYSTMFSEIEEQLKGKKEPEPEIMVVQIGVGSLAASLVQFYRNRDRIPIPRIIGVEPEGAACALASVKKNAPVSVTGPHCSVMAGLNCGTLSSIAWPLLRDGIDIFVTVDDNRAFEAMRTLADDGIVSGESGAAGAAGLFELFETDTDGSIRQHLGINRTSTILLISTEGATDPELYRHEVILNT